MEVLLTPIVSNAKKMAMRLAARGQCVVCGVTQKKVPRKGHSRKSLGHRVPRSGRRVVARIVPRCSQIAGANGAKGFRFFGNRVGLRGGAIPSGIVS